MVKSLFTAYVLWLFGGLFGLHHLYLGRDRQAFIYFSTLGGFLVGYIYDLYRMPDYVREANLDASFTNKLNKLQFQLKAPAFLAKRFFSCVVIGAYFSNLVIKCVIIEKDMSNILTVQALQLLHPLVVALIVYYVGTDGPIECQFKWPLIGSYIGFLTAYYFGIVNGFMYLTSPIAATFYLNWNISWDKEYISKKKANTDRFSKRLVKFLALISLFMLLFGVFCWHNVKVTGKNGETLTLKESATVFFESDQFKVLRETLTQVWNFYKAHGLWKTIEQLFYNGDSGAVSRAYGVSIILD